MQKYKEYMKNRTFTHLSFFIIFTATVLYIAYFIVKDFTALAGSGLAAINSVIGALSPLWIGLILAYLLNPLVESLDRKLLRRIIVKPSYSGAELTKKLKKCRIISILMTFILVVLILIGLLYAFASLIMGKLVFESLPTLFNSLVDMVTNYEADFQKWSSSITYGAFSDYLTNFANRTIGWITANFSASGLISHIANFSTSILNFLLGIVVSIYLLADKSFFIKLWKRLMSLIFPRRSDSIHSTLIEINGVLSRFVRGVLLDAFLVGILSTIGLTLMGLDFAIFIGIFAGVVNVIPYFGPLIGMIPAFLVGMLTDSTLTGVIAVLILFCVQQIDVNIIYPRVVGSSTGLKPLFVLLAVSVGGYYQGILGMIIAVPVTSIIQLFLRRWAKKRELKLADSVEAMNLDESHSK